MCFAAWQCLRSSLPPTSHQAATLRDTTQVRKRGLYVSERDAAFWCTVVQQSEKTWRLIKDDSCRLSAALMQIAAIFSAIACLCYSQLTVYPSGWFITALQRRPCWTKWVGPTSCAQYRIHCRCVIMRCIYRIAVLRYQCYYDSCLELNWGAEVIWETQKRTQIHVVLSRLVCCVSFAEQQKGRSLSCSGVTDDEIHSPSRQMEVGGGGLIFFWGWRWLSGKAMTSSHLTHNPI